MNSEINIKNINYLPDQDNNSAKKLQKEERFQSKFSFSRKYFGQVDFKSDFSNKK